MEAMNTSGVTVVGSDAPSEYHVAPRTENSNQVAAGSSPAEAPQVTTVPAPQVIGPLAMVVAPVKKKRGRPRKYGPDGSVTKALSPKPISSSAPPSVIDFSAEKPKGKIKPPGSANKHFSKMGMESLGDWVSCSVGGNFTPHIITVNAGEDVTMKPDSSGGTLTYEGRFEILSLTGSFMPSENGGIRNRSGGMSVSLAGPDGRVVGGGVAGLLVAASPVQIVVGSFLTGSQHEQKIKKQKMDNTTTAAPTAAIPISMAAIPISNAGQQHPSATVNHNVTSLSFGGENWSSYPSDSRNNPTDINVTLPG
ncbi:AT-hook motif nuclear-localized protein [Heracleum sosnowskyi]|uniref:AT-hook motif nuclear-localized protein n=1 Tax=Heracleum sosnowskyi TaxID=360622 RepID=A0AAD8MU11_9APIA|nr:AT-hook motif nuclear-localized protein [Heracleum sosnowskyi]